MATPKTYFTEYFDVDPTVLEGYGAFDISLVTDLPLFIDPFLLFNSDNPDYQELHDEIIRYLVFLRDKAQSGELGKGLIDAWYRFPEVRQNWFGFTTTGNLGSGLGRDFAEALRENLHRLFPNFGEEPVTKGSHLEKLCLIRPGVGRDNISDFTTNLIKAHLCVYTEAFALEYVREEQRGRVSVPKVRFNYDTESWESATYTLPWANGDYVLLTPKDMLTKDDTWINRQDLLRRFADIPNAISDAELRAQVDNYFRKVLVSKPDEEPTQEEFSDAAIKTLLQFPALIDYFIKYKEDHGDEAKAISSGKVRLSERVYVAQVRAFKQFIAEKSPFYNIPGNTYDEARQRLDYLKDLIENKGCHKIFYVDGEPIQREEDLHVMYRLVWFGSPSDVSREVNDGRGPADFKVSRGRDKTIVEFKLAKNTQLKRNLKKQAEIYQKASDAQGTLKAILYFSEDEFGRVKQVLKDVGLEGHKDIVLIDARDDNKPSGSKA